MHANDLMSSPVVTVSVDGTVGDAADLMLGHGISCLPVVDARGRVVGMLTHADFGLHHKFMPTSAHLYTLFGAWASPANLEQVSRQVRDRPLREVMSQPVATVPENASVAEVAEAMVRHKVHRLPVTRGDEMVGMISRHDMMKLMAAPKPSDESAGE